MLPIPEQFSIVNTETETKITYTYNKEQDNYRLTADDDDEVVFITLHQAMNNYNYCIYVRPPQWRIEE